MNQEPLEIKKKDSWSKKLIFSDEDNTRIDITGWKVYFMLKTNITDADVSAVISKTITVHTDAANGETEINLSSTDTSITVGCYHYAIKVITDETVGGVAEAITVLEGMITVADCVVQQVS